MMVTILPADRGNGEMAAQNYSTFFQEFLHPAHNHMVAASALTDNPSLKTFLRSRANAFITNDYYQSDKDWMDLDSKIEVTIGPYETYEDGFLGLKASFEAFVTLTDPVESAKLARFKSYLPDMEQNLPIEEAMKTDRGAESPIRVVDLVFAAGDARKSVQTLAFNLPNDERVRKEKGAKKVMLKNQIANKFSKILVPIATELLAEDLLEHVDGEAFFYNILFHELSHSIGPAYVNNDESQAKISVSQYFFSLLNIFCVGSHQQGAGCELLCGGGGQGGRDGRVQRALHDPGGCHVSRVTCSNVTRVQCPLHGPARRDQRAAARQEPRHLRGRPLQVHQVRCGGVSRARRGAAAEHLPGVGGGDAGLRDGAVQRAPGEAGAERGGAGGQALHPPAHRGQGGQCQCQGAGEVVFTACVQAVEAELARLGVLDEVTSANLARLDQVPVDIRPCYPLAGENCPQPSKWWRLLPPV